MFRVISYYCSCVSCVQLAAVQDEDEEESGSDADEEGGPKLRSAIAPGSNPVPLGWPKVSCGAYPALPYNTH